MRDFSPTLLSKIIDKAALILPARLVRSLRWRYFRWARRTAAAGFDVEAQGYRWRLHPADNVTEKLIWLYREHPEPQSLAWALAAVEGRAALILDIGANCGAFIVPLAAAGAGSRCLAFEPNPTMVERLKVNLHLNDLATRVEVHPVALGAESGEAVLSFSGNLGEATLQSDPERATHQVHVPLRRLSDLLTGTARYETFFLKIDVEGYEPEVLMPFFATVDRSLWPTHILIETEHRNDWSADLGGQLAALGYETVDTREGNTFLRYRKA